MSKVNISREAACSAVGVPKNPNVNRKSDKERLNMDMRSLRVRILSVFDEIGGADKLLDWVSASDRNYEKFLLQIVVPMLPKEVNDDGFKLKADAVTLQFNKQDYYDYLKRAREHDVN